MSQSSSNLNDLFDVADILLVVVDSVPDSSDGGKDGLVHFRAVCEGY